MSPYDPPDWLRGFVSDEVRPLLLADTKTAIQALKRWQEQRSKQRQSREKWESGRNKYLRKLAKSGQQVTPPECPGAGWTWCEWWSDPSTGQHHIQAWLPPELSVDNAPPFYDNPLRHWIVRHDPVEPSLDRDFPSEECWVTLMAIHDEVRIKAERIVPLDTLDYRIAVPFAVVSSSVRELTEEHLPELRRMVRIAAKFLKKSAKKGKSKAVLRKAQVTPSDPSAFIPAKDCRNNRIRTHKQLIALLDKSHNNNQGMRREHRGQHLWIHGGDWHRWNAEQDALEESARKKVEESDPYADAYSRALEFRKPEIREAVLARSLANSRGKK